jgi:hypothetical protein
LELLVLPVVGVSVTDGVVSGLERSGSTTTPGGEQRSTTSRLTLGVTLGVGISSGRLLEMKPFVGVVGWAPGVVGLSRRDLFVINSDICSSIARMATASASWALKRASMLASDLGGVVVVIISFRFRARSVECCTSRGAICERFL